MSSAYGSTYRKRKRAKSKTRRYKKRRRTSRSGIAATTRSIGAQITTRPELKNIDVTHSVLLQTPAGVGGDQWMQTTAGDETKLMNGCANGTGSTNRIGRKIAIKSIAVNAFIEGFSITSLTGVPMFRLMCIYDKSPQGAFPTGPGDIFNQISSTSMLNLDKTDRFMIIWDKMLTPEYSNAIPAIVTSGSSGMDAQTLFAFKLYQKFKPRLETIFGNTAGTIADIQSGALYLLCGVMGSSWTDNALGQFRLIGSTRVRFTDA